MKRVIFAAMLAAGVLTACNSGDKQTTDKDMKQELTQEWDKVFPLSEKVNHKKVTFETPTGFEHLGLSTLWYSKLSAILPTEPRNTPSEASTVASSLPVTYRTHPRKESPRTHSHHLHCQC